MAYILNKIPILHRIVLYKNASFIPTVRFMSMGYNHLTNRTNVKAEQRFKLKDNISSNYKLIYRERGTFNLTIIVAYCLGWLGLAGGIISMGYLIYKNPPLQQEGLKNDFGEEIIKPFSKLGRIIVIIVSVTLSIVGIIVSRIIPFRIYHNPTEKLYKAVFVSNALGKTRMLTFGEGTVVPKFKHKYLADVLYDVNGYTILLDKECFPVPYVREQMIRKTV